MGHRVVAPDLPSEDPDATFDDYATVVLEALENVPGDQVVVVGFSLGGHTAAVVAALRPVRELIYLAAMVPEPGLSLNDQFARGDSHDCDEPVARERFERSRSQSNRPFRARSSLKARPDVPTRYIVCSEDRLMDNSFWRVAVRARLGTEPVELGGSHSPMAAQPEKLARLLTSGSSP